MRVADRVEFLTHGPKLGADGWQDVILLCSLRTKCRTSRVTSETGVDLRYGGLVSMEGSPRKLGLPRRFNCDGQRANLVSREPPNRGLVVNSQIAKNLIAAEL